MSIGLRLLAKLELPAHEPDTLLGQTAIWIQRNYSGTFPRTRQGFVNGFPTLFFRLHPAAEEVEISIVDPEYVVASANTSTVGPGYHIYICSLLKDWAGDFHASWKNQYDDSGDYYDETEYFFTEEQQKVFDSMTSWLRSLANTFFEEPIDPNSRDVALCMPMDVQYESGQPAVTPLGPRDHTWLHETSQDGIKGRDFFAWWSPGLNAEYFLRRAKGQMWSNVRWRSPINVGEAELLREVSVSLQTAFNLDPNLDYPWAEWAEILNYLGANSAEIDSVRSRLLEPATIGYRRGNVTGVLPRGWKMRLPGSFSDFEPDEDDSLLALDLQKEIWFASYRFSADAAGQAVESLRRNIRESHPEFVREDNDFIAAATIEKKLHENGENYFVLNSSNVTSNRRAVCTIVYPRADRTQWALDVWRSIHPPSRS